ncbi:MAG: hypothetical protein ACKOWD_06730 [Rhodoferax sp.]
MPAETKNASIAAWYRNRAAENQRVLLAKIGIYPQKFYFSAAFCKKYAGVVGISA